jgi:hypothetical protein
LRFKVLEARLCRFPASWKTAVGKMSVLDVVSTEETNMLLHKHSGKITAITAIGHETYKGVADRFFIGSVEWRDGSSSKDIHIAPIALCGSNDEDKPAIDSLMKQLTEYLNEAGDWHDMKHKRDGRCYS